MTCSGFRALLDIVWDGNPGILLWVRLGGITLRPIWMSR